MNLRDTFLYIATVLIFVGCTSIEPKVENTELKADRKELTALNNAYRENEITAETYIKQARILNAKIHNQEEALQKDEHIY